MNRKSVALVLSVVALSMFAATLNGQIKSKQERDAIFAQLADDEEALAQCLKTMREEQIRKFGRPIPRPSGHCWEGCPTSVPKPYYPETARRLRISGKVVVDTVVDEKGNVAYAKVSKGSSIFKRAALEAAYKSSYQPKISCGDRRIKFRWTITYYFHPEM